MVQGGGGEGACVGSSCRATSRVATANGCHSACALNYIFTTPPSCRTPFQHGGRHHFNLEESERSCWWRKAKKAGLTE